MQPHGRAPWSGARYLGTTDPNAFQAGGSFNVGSFFSMLDAGASHGLGLLAFACTSCSALADADVFTSFTAASGAVFTAQAVPEPGTAWMVLAGLLAVAGVVRRR